MDDVPGNLRLHLFQVLFVHELPVLLEAEDAQCGPVDAGAGPLPAGGHGHDDLQLREEGVHRCLDVLRAQRLDRGRRAHALNGLDLSAYRVPQLHHLSGDLSDSLGGYEHAARVRGHGVGQGQVSPRALDDDGRAPHEEMQGLEIPLHEPLVDLHYRLLCKSVQRLLQSSQVSLRCPDVP